MKKLIIAAALAFVLASPAYALTHYLTAQWVQNGNQMCRYDDGTVMNIGVGLCPLSI